MNGATTTKQGAPPRIGETTVREGRSIDVVALVVGCGLWGLAWWPMKALAGMGLSGPQLAIVAYGAAALCLLPAVVRRRSAARGAAMLGLIMVGGGVWNVAFMTAMIEGAASRVVLLYYVASGLAILGGRFLFREAIDGPRRIAMGLVFGGALLVLGDPEHALDTLGPADVLALVAGVAHAVTNLTFRASERTPLVLQNFAMFVGAIAAAVLVLAGMGMEVGVVRAAGGAGWAGGGEWPGGETLLLGAAFGGGWLLFAESLTQHGVSRLPATRSAVLLISELPITVASASLLAGERLGLSALVGGGLITWATWLEARRPNDAITIPVPTSTRRAQHGLE